MFDSVRAIILASLSAFKQSWANPRGAAARLAGLLILLAMLAVPTQSGVSTATVVAAPPAPASISITASGFSPSMVTVQVGQSVGWTNDSGSAQSVTADSGLFDSGSLAPGAGFSMAAAIPADHYYKSTTNPAFTGIVRVVPLGLDGAATDLANSHIPDQAFAPSRAADMSAHPLFALTASRTRLLLGFTPTATVAEAWAGASVRSSRVGRLERTEMFWCRSWSSKTRLCSLGVIPPPNRASGHRYHRWRPRSAPSKLTWIRSPRRVFKSS